MDCTIVKREIRDDGRRVFYVEVPNSISSVDINVIIKRIISGEV